MTIPPLDPQRVPLMPPEEAQEIARGLKWLAQSYENHGMLRQAQRFDAESQWWMTYALSLSQTPPAKPPA